MHIAKTFAKTNIIYLKNQIVARSLPINGKSLEEEGAPAVVVSVLCVMRLPRSLRKSMPSLLIAPIVSAATGTNKYE